MKTILFILILSCGLVSSQVNQSQLERILDNLPLPKFTLTYDELKNKSPKSYQDEDSPYNLKLEEADSFREEIESASVRSKNKHGSPQAIMIFAKRNASGDPLKYIQLSDNFSKKAVVILEQLNSTNQKIIDDGDKEINRCGQLGEGTKNANQIVECQKKAALNRDNSALVSTDSTLKELSVEFDVYLADMKRYFKTLSEEVISIIRIDRNALFEINWYYNQMIETVSGILDVIANLHEVRESTIIAFNHL